MYCLETVYSGPDNAVGAAVSSVLKWTPYRGNFLGDGFFFTFLRGWIFGFKNKFRDTFENSSLLLLLVFLFERNNS
jgi:hypothetical protein